MKKNLSLIIFISIFGFVSRSFAEQEVGGLKSEKSSEKSKIDNEVVGTKNISSEVDSGFQESGQVLMDKIETVIYGSEDTSIITKSDLDRVGLDGQKRTKDGMAFELLVYQDAKKYNIMDEKLVDRYIESIQTQQNLTIDDIKKMFHDSGYTYEEGREQLGMYNTINQMMDYKVRSKVIIPEKEVRKYYDDNPVWQEEAYKLQRIFVPYEATKLANAQEIADLNNKKIEEVASSINSKKLIPEADYSEDFWVEKPELADDKKFISDMKVGQVSTPVFVEGGLECYKLVQRRDRKLMTFEQRYREIGETLREPLYQKLFEDYKKNLFKDSVIIDL